MCKCCEEIEFLKEQEKNRNSKFYSKITVYGWRDRKRRIVEFGTGDINIIPGILIEEEMGIIGLREQEPRKIGLNNGDKPPENINMFKILLQFNKVDSIDVLIHALEETKKMMNNRNKIIKKAEKGTQFKQIK